jgi:hypothetical protein
MRKAVRLTGRKKGRKAFVVQIFTVKPLWLKILQSIFANTVPVQAFRGTRGIGS